jgi:perosamine synthetase
VNRIEKYLAKEHGRKYCILVGNGTTAIYLSLVAQEFENNKIAIPNNVCMNVILPIYFSNNTPVFIDIEKETLGLDINKMPKNEIISGMVAVHSYGNSCKINEIVEYSKKNNIFLIEDAAVSQGGDYFSRKLGTFGEVAILSFGPGKNINIGHGGAILLDSKDTYSVIREKLFELGSFSKNKEKQANFISKKHTKLYNIDFGKSLNRHHKEFKSLCLDNKSSFLYKFNEEFYGELESKLLKLDKYIEKRKEQSLYLKEKFQGVEGVEILESINGSTYWRFNIFLEKYRDELFLYLIGKKYKVSSWYHSIDLLFEKRESLYTPNSDWAGESVINIWVNEDVDKRYLDKISSDIVNFLGKKKC